MEQALKAEILFKRDKDYVVKNGEVIIVDEFTGRMMPGRRWSEGLHQAVEAKEGVKIEKESKTLATITFQNYFRLYKKLAGMTGTAQSSAEEFHKVYKLSSYVIPTNKPMARKVSTDKKTKRIEFLVKYKGINPNKILAITFTRKAREEMQYRLVDLGINTNVETFNSFSEKILLKHENQIYGRKMNVISYGNKVMAIMSALSDLGLTMNQVIEIYFSDSQRRNKTSEQLSNTLMNDCFFILEYFKSRNDEFYDFSEDAFGKDKPAAKTIYNICKHLKKYMDLSGLRDYTDQIIETIKFFESNKQYIPEFEYVLVDEYQDVNSMQIKLLNLLKPKNLFCVGDPRQSIFGWRGSDINYILKFQEKYPESEIITLIKNYRSTNHLVNLMNSSIRIMSLPDLENSYEDEKKISLLNFDSEEKEMNFVISEILSSDLSKDDIFVLSRTNYQLTELSKFMKRKNIPHILKTDDFLNGSTAKKGEVTLATIHSIKGLEAHKVFIIGCNEINFPCKASDHPVIEMIKIDNYDKEEEERRLFYVAISRAKKELFLTYTGKKPTYFINSEMLKIISGDDF